VASCNQGSRLTGFKVGGSNHHETEPGDSVCHEGETLTRHRHTVDTVNVQHIQHQRLLMAHGQQSVYLHMATMVLLIKMNQNYDH